MAQINSFSTNVGSLLGITLSATTNPTTTEVQDWLLRGAKELILQMPLRRLEKLYSPVAGSGSGQSQEVLGIVRLATVYNNTDKQPYEIVSKEIGQRFPYESAFTPYYAWIFEDDVYINRGTMDDVDIQCIVLPTGTTDWAPIFEEAIIEFALAKAKIPETDYSAWQAFYADWRKRLQTVEEIGEL